MTETCMTARTDGNNKTTMEYIGQALESKPLKMVDIYHFFDVFDNRQVIANYEIRKYEGCNHYCIAEYDASLYKNGGSDVLPNIFLYSWHGYGKMLEENGFELLSAALMLMLKGNMPFVSVTIFTKVNEEQMEEYFKGMTYTREPSWCYIRITLDATTKKIIEAKAKELYLDVKVAARRGYN